MITSKTNQQHAEMIGAKSAAVLKGIGALTVVCAGGEGIARLNKHIYQYAFDTYKRNVETQKRILNSVSTEKCNMDNFKSRINSVKCGRVLNSDYYMILNSKMNVTERMTCWMFSPFILPTTICEAVEQEINRRRLRKIDKEWKDLMFSYLADEVAELKRNAVPHTL
jgi:hypothetical protein